MLGHLVPFQYCAQCNDALPCRKIIDCWSHSMDVLEFLNSRYSPEQINTILAPAKPKMLQIIELAGKAAEKKG